MLSSATGASNNTGSRRQSHENDRTLVIFGLLGAHLGAFGILYFWITGAILLFTGNGGQLVELMQPTQVERWLYLAYPAVVLLSLFSWVFYALKRDLMALGLAGLPVVAAVVYFFYLSVGR